MSDPGPWALYPMKTGVFVTREVERGHKDQESIGPLDMATAERVIVYLRSGEDARRALRRATRQLQAWVENLPMGDIPFGQIAFRQDWRQSQEIVAEAVRALDPPAPTHVHNAQSVSQSAREESRNGPSRGANSEIAPNPNGNSVPASNRADTSHCEVAGAVESIVGREEFVVNHDQDLHAEVEALRWRVGEADHRTVGLRAEVDRVNEFYRQRTEQTRELQAENAELLARPCPFCGHIRDATKARSVSSELRVRAERAERERDSALERVKELEQENAGLKKEHPEAEP